MSANLATLHRTLASAHGEGMPLPVGVTVHGRYETRVQIHVDDAEERDQWQEWWTRHDADEEWTTEEVVADAYRHCFARGEWRGWLVELVHLAPVETEAGGSR